MSFAWPAALVLLLLVPLAAAAYIFVQRRRARYAVRFTNLDLLANVVEESPGWRRHLPAALYLLAIAALLLALARPERTTLVPKEQATVILVTDTSGSMNAKDVDPTRLAAAQEAGDVLLNELPNGFRVALVSFSNSVQTRVLPTTDKDAVRRALDALTANGGTAMGDALAHALDLTKAADESANAAGGATPSPTPTAAPSQQGGPNQQKNNEHPFVVVLLSDGFNTAGSIEPLDAAQTAVDMNVPVYTIALGTQDGVAEVTDNLGRTRYVRVPPDEDTLREIAKMTGAQFFSAPNASQLKSVYDDLGSKIGYNKEPREMTHLFAGAGALLVLVAGGLSLLWFNRFP